MNRAMEGMGGKVVKRYRIYERSLSEPESRKFRRFGPQVRVLA